MEEDERKGRGRIRRGEVEAKVIEKEGGGERGTDEGAVQSSVPGCPGPVLVSQAEDGWSAVQAMGDGEPRGDETESTARPRCAVLLLSRLFSATIFPNVSI